MPVSTRSQVTNQEQNDANQVQRTRTRHRSDQEEISHMNVPIRNPHHGLKEKMKALTLLYEQQKRASLALRNQSPNPQEKRFSTHPSVELLNSCRRDEKEAKDSNLLQNVMKENSMSKMPTKTNSTVTRTFVLPQPPMDDAKENLAMGPDRIIGFPSCARKANVTTTVARKLSMGTSLPQTEPKGVNVQESEKMEAVSEKVIMGGSRILVFVRLRPMSKKEKEAGSRRCVRIVNKRDVYLTEFANENDYLRLKRLRGRHFTFDASFPDSTSQQEVYSTT